MSWAPSADAEPIRSQPYRRNKARENQGYLSVEVAESLVLTTPLIPSVASSSASPSYSHMRVYQACIPCRRRKVKCDLGSVNDPSDPACVRCKREGEECFFSATRKKLKHDAGVTGEKSKSKEETPGQNRDPAEFMVLGGKEDQGLLEGQLTQWEEGGARVEQLYNASQQEVTRPPMLDNSSTSIQPHFEMTSANQSKSPVIMDLDDKAKDHSQHQTTTTIPSTDSELLSLHNLVKSLSRPVHTKEIKFLNDSRGKAPKKPRNVFPVKSRDIFSRNLFSSDNIDNSAPKLTPGDNMRTRVPDHSTTPRRLPRSDRFQPRTDLLQSDNESPSLGSRLLELDNKFKQTRGREAVPMPSAIESQQQDYSRRLSLPSNDFAEASPDTDENPASIELESLKDLGDRQRMTRTSEAVSFWIDSLRQSQHEDVYMVDPEPPGDNNDICPLDEEQVQHENRLVEGQVYYKSEVSNTVDIQLSQLSRHWQDGPSHPYATTTSFQPTSSNEAIMRWKCQADELSVVSRAATWGTRRRSDPSLSDIESKADGQLLKRIGTTPSNTSVLRQSSPLTSVFSVPSRTRLEEGQDHITGANGVSYKSSFSDKEAQHLAEGKNTDSNSRERFPHETFRPKFRFSGGWEAASLQRLARKDNDSDDDGPETSLDYYSISADIEGSKGPQSGAGAEAAETYSAQVAQSGADYSSWILPPAYTGWPLYDNSFPRQNGVNTFSSNAISKNGDPCQCVRDYVSWVLADSQSHSMPYSLDLDIDWDIPSFVLEQYEEMPVAIDTIITLSGTALRAQAATCGAYVVKQWPRYGSKIITVLQTALDAPSKTSTLIVDDIEISIEIGTHVVANLKGDQSAIMEATLVLAWMGTALRTSSSSTVQYSELCFIKNYFEEGVVNGIYVGFKTIPLPQDEESCWYPLFVNPVIARGFPTIPRENNEAGLEIPLEMMVALGGARYAVEFEGGLLLKGLSSMFVPTKRHENSIQWHLIHHTAKTRLSYSEVKIHCPERALLDEVNHDSLQDTRAFLGWWRTSKTNLGMDDYNYAATTYSSAMPSSNVSRALGGLNFSKLLSGSQNMSIGAKDSRLFLSRTGPLEQIMEWAEMMPIILYDVADRRGWFVRASDVILHMIHTRHSKRPFRIEGKPVRLVGANQDYGDQAAEIAIMDMASVKLVQDDVNRANDYYLNDLVSDIWALLEGLSEMQDASYTSPEDPTQEKLQGWEFMALVDRKSPIQRKEVSLENSTGGWQHLVHDVNAIVLLANGFGDLIQPTSPTTGLCQRWRALPKDRSYMASAIPLLKMLCEEAGSASPYLHLTPSKLQWHKKSMLFDDCDGKGTLGGMCYCQRLQQVIPQSTSEVEINPPGHLEEKGCVIFGLPESVPRPPSPPTSAPMTDTMHNYSNGNGNIAIDHLDVTEIAKPSFDNDLKIVSPSSPRLSVSLPILDGKSPSQEWEGNGDYRCNGLYPKSRGSHESSDLFFGERAMDWSLRLPLDDSFNVKKAKKRNFNVHDELLPDSKRVHVDEFAISIAASKRTCLDEVASPISQTGRIWETMASRETLPISIRDSQNNIRAREFIESDKSQQYVVTLESPGGIEK